jgi:ribosomal protein L15
MNLSNLQPVRFTHNQNKRLGRGEGSGWYSARGHKRSKLSYSKRLVLKGQMPLQRRVPKLVSQTSIVKITKV